MSLVFVYDQSRLGNSDMFLIMPAASAVATFTDGKGGGGGVPSEMLQKEVVERGGGAGGI